MNPNYKSQPGVGLPACVAVRGAPRACGCAGRRRLPGGNWQRAEVAGLRPLLFHVPVALVRGGLRVVRSAVKREPGEWGQGASASNRSRCELLALAFVSRAHTQEAQAQIKQARRYMIWAALVHSAGAVGRMVLEPGRADDRVAVL